jgi:transcriptional regulator with XRE-family HTH domain
LSYKAEKIITHFLTIVNERGRKMSREEKQHSFEKLEKLVVARKTTIYRLSESTGIARSTFSDWKHGKSMPKTDKLLKLAEYFGVTVDYFLS